MVRMTGRNEELSEEGRGLSSFMPCDDYQRSKGGETAGYYHGPWIWIAEGGRIGGNKESIIVGLWAEEIRG